jgi:hypothetical protein
MNANEHGHLDPVVLPGGGLFVPAEAAGILAAAVSAWVRGRAPSPTRTLIRIGEAAADAAREHEAARHRAAAEAAAFADESRMRIKLLSIAQAAAPSDPATVNVKQAAEILGLTEARIRQLATAGTIRGVRGSRRVWTLERSSVDRLKARRRRTTREAARPAGAPGTAEPVESDR